MNHIEPAHVIMLRGRLDKSHLPSSLFRGVHQPSFDTVRDSARRLRLWNRVTKPVREFAELSQLPLGLVLLAMGKGV